MAVSVPNFDSPRELKSLLEAQGLAMSKTRGQNFLIDAGVRKKIITLLLNKLAPLALDGQAKIWEIGPGLGSLTSLCLQNKIAVTAFELDHGFARLLTDFFSAENNFKLVEGDFLKNWQEQLTQSGPPHIIFGNLPYNVANAMIISIIEGFSQAHIPLVPLIFTVQKECALRITSPANTKDYSAFTVLCSSFYKTEISFDISPAAFWPVPNVISSIMVMQPIPALIAASEQKEFSNFVRTGFANRRKTLRNNLKNIIIDTGRLDAALAQLKEHPIDVRAEALSPAELATLYKSIYSAEK